MLKIALAALATATVVASPVAAAPFSAGETAVVIGYADLDLSRADHQAMLAKRIERAAEDACVRPFIRDLKGMDAYDRCVTDAKAAAQHQVALVDAPAAASLAAL